MFKLQVDGKNPVTFISVFPLAKFCISLFNQAHRSISGHNTHKIDWALFSHTDLIQHLPIPCPDEDGVALLVLGAP